jgi:hypothetical protein
MIQRAFSIVCVLLAWGTSAFGQDLPDVTPPKDDRYGACLQNTSEDCPPQPPTCGTITCNSGAVRWVADPSDACSEIPEVDFSCPDFSREPCEYNEGSIPICADAEDPRPRSGYDHVFEKLPDVICWKVRPCAHSCWKTAIPLIVYDSRRISPYPENCPTTYVARKITIYKHKCNSGQGNGDPDFESEWHKEDAFKCVGEILPCIPSAPNDPPTPPSPGPGKPELVPDIDDPIGQK